MSRKRLRKRGTVVGAAIAAMGMSLSVSAALIPVYGGPTWDETTQTGYARSYTEYHPGSSVGNGVAVGDGSGGAAFRWDSSGSVFQLPSLELDSNGNGSALAYAINRSGTIVGGARKFASGRLCGLCAVRWDASGEIKELGNIVTAGTGYANSLAVAVNDAGVAAGYADVYLGGIDIGRRPVRWDASGKATELGILGTSTKGDTFTEVFAINNAGVAVGRAGKYDSAGTGLADRAVRWDAQTGEAIELEYFGGDSSGPPWSSAYAINDAGTVVGMALKVLGSAYFGPRAVRWDASGNPTELGHIGTDSKGFTFASAVAINAAGTAVGFAEKHDGDTWIGNRGVRWDPSSTVAIELGDLGSGSIYTNLSATAINDAGAIVGIARKFEPSNGDAPRHAVVWTLEGIGVDLNTLIDPNSGWTLNESAGISQTNWISGIGTFDPDGDGPLSGYQRAYLLNVSPLLPYEWQADGDGSWGLSTNWSSKVTPNDSTAVVRFGGKISSGRVVTLEGERIVHELHFDNVHPYTITAGTLTVGDGISGLIEVTNGTHEISADLRFSGSITKTGPGTLVISGIQRHATNSSLAVTDGLIRLESNVGAAATAAMAAAAPLAVSVSEAGHVMLGSDEDLHGLDIYFGAPGSQQFDVASGSESGAVHAVRIYAADLAAAKQSLYQAIRNTQSAGAVDPTDGIYDSTQSLHANSAIGLAQSVDAHGDAMLLLRLTRLGDVNLDGVVSIADFLHLAAHFGGPGAWDEGDLNYDGLVSIADFIILSSNFNTSYDGDSFPISPADQQILSAFQASVPEPGAAVVCVLSVIALRRRRRG